MIVTNSNLKNRKIQIQKRNLIWLVAIFIFFSTYFYVPPAYSDLGRYYDLIETLSSFNNIIYAVLLQQEQDVDFIFTLTMLGALKVGIKLQFVTALVCSVYWVIIARAFIKPINKINSFILLCFLGVLFFPNMMEVIGTARNVMAFLFLFTGFQYWSNNKKIWSVICFVLSIFTHFSCLIHITLFLAVLFVYKIWFYKYPGWTNLLCLVFPVFTYVAGATIINGIFLSPVMQDLFGDSAGYGSYVAKEAEKITYDFVGIGQIAYLLSHIFVIYVLINIDRRNSLSRVMVMVFFSMITMSYAFNYNLLVRFFLCMAFFYSTYVSDCISNLNKKTNLLRLFLTLSSVLLILIFVWNYHGLIMKYWQF